MPNIDKYPAGAFVWVELGTTDQAAAKTFYGALFGWAANEETTSRTGGVPNAAQARATLAAPSQLT